MIKRPGFPLVQLSSYIMTFFKWVNRELFLICFNFKTIVKPESKQVSIMAIFTCSYVPKCRPKLCTFIQGQIRGCLPDAALGRERGQRDLGGRGHLQAEHLPQVTSHILRPTLRPQESSRRGLFGELEMRMRFLLTSQQGQNFLP